MMNASFVTLVSAQCCKKERKKKSDSFVIRCYVMMCKNAAFFARCFTMMM